MKDKIIRMTPKLIRFECGISDSDREDVLLTSDMFFCGCKLSVSPSLVNPNETLYRITYHLGVFISRNTDTKYLDFHNQQVVQKVHQWILYQIKQRLLA